MKRKFLMEWIGPTCFWFLRKWFLALPSFPGFVFSIIMFVVLFLLMVTLHLCKTGLSPFSTPIHLNNGSISLLNPCSSCHYWNYVITNNI